MTKIRLTCSWCDDKTLFERFTRVYLSKHNLNSKYEFTIDNNFDYLVVINGPRYSINFPREKTLGVIMEPSNSPTTKLYQPHLEQICKHILWHYKTESPQYIYYPGLLPYHMDYESGADLDYYLDTTFQKNKLCSFIVSYNTNDSFPTSIYSQRVNLAKQILNSDLDIDIYGNCWEQSGIKDSRIKGQIRNKKDGLIDYKYSIAIENCIEDSYFTEKLTDCVLTNTTPIYYGCSNINTFFSNIITLQNLNSVDQLTQFLNNSINVFDKTILAKKFNLYTAIVKYLQQCQPN